jgi:methyl-accepting chemotaxis protein
VQAKEMLNSVESINKLVADARGQVAQTRQISQSLAALSDQLTRQLGLFQVNN